MFCQMPTVTAVLRHQLLGLLMSSNFGHKWRCFGPDNCELPLRFVDDFIICSAAGEDAAADLLPLDEVVASQGLLRGWLVPCKEAQDQRELLPFLPLQ